MKFVWLIEMQGPAYLTVKKLGSYDFLWTDDATKAIQFTSQQQANDVMYAIRELRQDLFPLVLTRPIQATQHGWYSAE